MSMERVSSRHTATFSRLEPSFPHTSSSPSVMLFVLNSSIILGNVVAVENEES